jgi:hypothetical protein
MLDDGQHKYIAREPLSTETSIIDRLVLRLGPIAWFDPGI